MRVATNRKPKAPGDFKEQITVTLKVSTMDKLPKRRGETSKLIEQLLTDHFNLELQL